MPILLCLLILMNRVYPIDWERPSVQDFVELQKYLLSAPRPELELSKEYSFQGDVVNTRRYRQLRNFRFIDPSAKEVPKLQHVIFQTTPEDKRFCLITYASCNTPYETFPLRIIEALQSTGYQGHFLYQIGGWPLLSEGSLHYFDTPYAFKVLMFEEAKALGYENILWIDVAAIPTTNLEELFTEIQHKKATFLMDRIPFTHRIFHYALQQRNDLLLTLHTTYEELKSCKHLNGRMIGLNTKDKAVLAFLTAWKELLKEKIVFSSPSVEQLPLSYLAHKYGIAHTVHPLDFHKEHFQLLPHGAPSS